MNPPLREVDASTLSISTYHLWSKALLATKINNNEYAILLFSNILKTSPGFVECRKRLRDTQIRQCSLERQSSTRKGKSLPLLVKILTHKNPHKALEKIETLLARDPFSVALNEGLYQCAFALQLHKTAEFALETIHTYRFTHSAPLHKLAEHYSALAKYTEAAKVYQTIIRYKPSDSKAIRKEKDSIAKASMAHNKSDSLSMEAIDKTASQKDSD